VADDAAPDDLLDLDEALDRLALVDARGAELVKLRLYAGLSLDEAAAALGVVRRTAARDWAFARAWLFRQLMPPDAPCVAAAPPQSPARPPARRGSPWKRPPAWKNLVGFWRPTEHVFW